MSDNRSIGVFDSGLGGLTVLSAITQKYPNESIVYLGDTARLPYGTKSADTVVKYAFNCAQALMQTAELKLLVIACNTATAHALPQLAKKLPIPVIGVIESGAREIATNPQIKSVAILATAGTIRSKAYEIELKKQGFQGKVFPLACPLFVSLAEEGLLDGPITQAAVQHYLSQLPEIPDAVVLGCTHYPLLLPALKKALPSKTIWIDSGKATAQDLRFAACNLKKSTVSYYVTDAPERFLELSSLFLGHPVPATQIHLIDTGLARPNPILD